MACMADAGNLAEAIDARIDAAIDARLAPIKTAVDDVREISKRLLRQRQDSDSAPPDTAPPRTATESHEASVSAAAAQFERPLEDGELAQARAEHSDEKLFKGASAAPYPD